MTSEGLRLLFLWNARMRRGGEIARASVQFHGHQTLSANTKCRHTKRAFVALFVLSRAAEWTDEEGNVGQNFYGNSRCV